MTQPTIDLANMSPADIAALAEALAPLLKTESVTLVERTEDEVEESIEFVRTGMIRFKIDGKTYRLRRPFFGELRDLRTGLERQTDELTMIRMEVEHDQGLIAKEQDLLNRRMDEVLQALDEAASNPELDGLPDDLLAKREDLLEKGRALRARIIDNGRKITKAADDLRLSWYEQAFEVLGVDDPKRPDDFPSWVGDENLVGQIVSHWRSVPLARGRAG